MITPILVDLALNVTAFLFGLYIVICKMGAFNRAILHTKSRNIDNSGIYVGLVYLWL